MEENWALLTLKKTFGSGLAFISPRLKETCLPALIASFLRRPNFLQTRLLLLAREKSVCPHQRAVAQWDLCRAEISLTLEITEIWSQSWGHLPLPCASPPAPREGQGGHSRGSHGARPQPPPTGMTSLLSRFPGILKPEIIFPTPTPGIFLLTLSFWLLSVPIAKQREIQPERLDGGVSSDAVGRRRGRTLRSPQTFPKLANFTSISASSITTTFQVIFCDGISGGT